MLDYAFDIIDGIVACFSTNFAWSGLAATFWFLLFVEFPRYYLTDVLVTIYYGATFHRRRNRDMEARYRLYLEKPLVTILAPGKNEGEHIYKLVQSLREQTYNHFEIIIIDDGSDDATPLICRDLQRGGYIDKFFRMTDRGGKASAANYGVTHAKGKYIVHLDADSSLDRDAIEKILLPFYFDRNIKAVGGCVKVRNADASLCASMQALEYLRSIQVGRMVTNMLGIYHIISGAFGAFDTEILREVGGWDIGPGLDGDITQKFRKAGYKVWFAQNAICMTNVPVKWYALFRQRKRWSKSLVRFRIRKHRDILWSNRNFSFLNMISNAENILFDFIFNYVWLFYIITLVFANTDRLLEILIVGWILRFSFSIVAFMVMQCVSERAAEERKLAAFLMFHTFYMGYFMRFVRLVGHTEELFFYTSYRDNWNPRKTSEIARMEGL